MSAYVRLYQRTLHRVRPDNTRKFKVYLFRGRTGFTSYLGQVGMLWGTTGDGAAGLYSPVLKQLLVCASARKERTLGTLRHEGLHQYLDRFLPNAPLWFNEGLAVYYQNTARKTLGRLETGQVDHDLVRRLGKHVDKHGRLMQLRHVFGLKPKEFYGLGEDRQLGYAHAWLIVHHLRHGGRDETRLFDALVEALQEHSGDKAVDEVFTEEVLRDFEPGLGSYLASLRSR